MNGNAVRAALVTGSARGLGRSIAEALAQQGIALMLVDVLADRLEATRRELQAQGARCVTFPTDAAAPFWFAQAAMPHLIATEGNIVNVLSQSALMGTPYLAPYSMSKAALLQLTKSLAVEYADMPIRINAVAPGAMLTEISTDTRPPTNADFAKIKRYSGQRPPANAAAVAAVVAFISSPLACAVHGAIWTADGGVTAG